MITSSSSHAETLPLEGLKVEQGGFTTSKADKRNNSSLC